VVDYSFGNFKLLLTATAPPTAGGVVREAVTPAAADELSVASFNVENLDPGDSTFAGLAALIVDNLGSPDLIGLEEIQDDNGATNDSVVDAGVTLSRLRDAIVVAGGPLYDFRDIDPQDDQDGGQPGGNIRNAFLFRTDRGLTFMDRPGGSATTPVSVVGGPGGPALSVSPGRIQPGDPAWSASRKPLVGEFTYRGERLFVISDHFRSKGGDEPLFGRSQPPARSSEVQRHQQARLVNDFVDQLLAADPSANVLELGDHNDFQFSRTLEHLTGAGTDLVDLTNTLPVAEQYTYVFEGNAQALDAILASPGMYRRLSSYDVVHVNAEFADQLSDHDPPIARFSFVPPAPDLIVTKAGTPGPVMAGNHLTYAISVSNTVAGSTAQAVVLTDVIPANTTFVSVASPPGWICATPAVGATGTVSCARPNLASTDGAQAFDLVVRVDLSTPTATSISTTVSVGSTPADSGPGANTAAISTPVTFAPSLPAVVRRSTTRLLRDTLTSGPPTSTFTYGTVPLVPLMGDWDGDGTRTAGSFEAGTFTLRNSNTSGPADSTFAFGDPRGFALAGDFDGDGLDDVAVYRAGMWQVRHTATGAGPTFAFGAGAWPSTVPVSGDWDGDGVDGVGTYSLATGTWNLRHTATAGPPDLAPFVFWGGAGSYPVTGDWDGDGIDTVGYKLGTAWSLRNASSPGSADLTLDYGLANDLPLTWRTLTPAIAPA